MFITILYIVFLGFSSMVLIIHVQIMYNVHKQLTIISMIFVYFTIFFSRASSKIDNIGFAQNRFGKPVKPIDLSGFCLIYQFSSKFSPIHILYRFCQFSVKLTKSVRSDFWGSADFSIPLYSYGSVLTQEKYTSGYSL
jgi:hypothetical protein